MSYRYPLSAAVPEVVAGTVGAVGAGVQYSRSNHAHGYGAYARTAVSTTPYAISILYTIYGVTSTSAITITLPTAASAGNGAWLYIKDESGNRANAITIDPNGAETIDGATTYTISVAYGSVMLYCDGSNWFVM